MEKITIGNSDYTREEIESGAHGAWGDVHTFLELIYMCERKGYTIVFKTSLLRRIFCTGKYKVIGIKS